jgi:DNA (cytosine-5)-methyltransferase 1
MGELKKSISARVVDLFCGAGGLSLGLRNAGLEIAAGCDLDSACQFPFEKNVRAPFYLQDVGSLKADTVSGWFGNADIRILAACAPCQPFSGYVVGRYGEDERWRLLLDVQRLTTQILPEIVTVENVSRLALRPLWVEFVNHLRAIGYSTSFEVVDCSQYGIPQRRRRLILLASRIGNISIPGATCEAPPTVRDAIAKFPSVAAGMAHESDIMQCARALTPANLARIQASSPGGTWRDWERSMRAECHKAKRGKTYPSVYGRMVWDKPSPTITTQFYGFGNGRFGHPEQDRALTLREGAALQTFPRDFEFVPANSRLNFRLVGRLIGNAVPVNLGHAIGKAIVDHVAGGGSGGRKKRRSTKKRSTAIRIASM